MDQMAAAWTLPRDLDLAAFTLAAVDLLEPADLRVQVLSSTGDTLTVQVVDGVAPYDPDTLVYVARRGAFEVLRREDWPGGVRRVVLVLGPWPRR